MRKTLILILPFTLSCIPGIPLTGNIIAQATDIFMPILLLASLHTSSSKMPMQYKKILRKWAWFVLWVMISFAINSIDQSTSVLSSFLKALRLCYPIILFIFLWKNKKYIHKDFDKLILMSGIFSSILTSYGYFYQIPFLSATQTIEIDGIVMNRAGSFWGDSGVVGLLSCFYILISISYLIHKNFQNKIWYILTYCCAFLNLTTIAISSSRSGIVALLGGIIVMIAISSKKILIKFIGLIIFFSFVIIFIYNSNYNKELNSFLDNRILELFTINNKNIENISSGRTEHWENVLQQFLNSNPITFILGTGYKMESKTHIELADNGYIYILTSTGIIGFILLSRFLIYLTQKYIRIKRYDKYPYITLSLLSSWLIASLTIDLLTYVSINLLLFIYIFLSLSTPKLKNNESFNHRRT